MREILTARSEEKGGDALDRIRREVPAANVRVELLDLASLRSVHAFAERVVQIGKLDLLVNNAGVMSVPTRELTEDGFERQFGTNFLGPFALTVFAASDEEGAFSACHDGFERGGELWV